MKELLKQVKICNHFERNHFKEVFKLIACKIYFSELSQLSWVVFCVFCNCVLVLFVSLPCAPCDLVVLVLLCVSVMFLCLNCVSQLCISSLSVVCLSCVGVTLLCVLADLCVSERCQCVTVVCVPELCASCATRADGESRSLWNVPEAAVLRFFFHINLKAQKTSRQSQKLQTDAPRWMGGG